MADYVQMIQLSPTMEEGVVVAWRKKKGDKVKTGDIIAEIETDKATMEMESFFDGVVLDIYVAEGATAKVGSNLALIGKPGESAPSASAPAPAAAPASTAPAPASVPVAAPAAAADAGRTLSSPMARKLAQEAGIPIGSVPGTGPAGRVVKRDVEAARSAAPAPVATSAPAPAAAPGVARTAPAFHVEPLSQMRKAISRNLSQAWQAPSFPLSRDVAMEQVLAIRQQLNDSLAARKVDTRISVNDFVIAAVARALRDVPDMNVAFTDDALHVYDHVDIGMAVAIEGGLITPVIRDADRKGLRAIAEEAKSLAERARTKKLAPHEFLGATFSISNLGMFGIDHFTAVLNPPAAGILAVGRTRATPVVDEKGAIVAGQRMNVTLTCDHRAVDGAVGARFVQRLVAYLESPSLLLL